MESMADFDFDFFFFFFGLATGIAGICGGVVFVSGVVVETCSAVRTGTAGSRLGKSGCLVIMGPTSAANCVRTRAKQPSSAMANAMNWPCANSV